MKNIAVIGAGYWGKNLVRNFSDLGVLKTICDPLADVQKSMQGLYPSIGIESELSRVLEDDDIQAVAIATPAETHFEVGLKALTAGKHVFMEKPLCLDVRHAEELIHLAEDKKRILMVGHVLHYHPAIIRMKELINEGQIGKVDYFYSNRLNLGKFRLEENILWSFAPHDISLMLSLVKDYPQTIYCMGGSYLSKSIADVTLCTFSFSSGVRGHIYVSWLHPTKEQKVVVVGNQGMLVFDDGEAPEKKLTLFRHKVLWKNGVPTPDKSEAEAIALSWSEPLRNECRAFLSAIESGKPPMTDGGEGLQTLRLLNDCQRSLTSGGPIASDSSKHSSDGPFIHPTAVIDSKVTLGQGTKVWHFAHVSEGARIGPQCSLGQNVFVGRHVSIGKNVKIQNNVSLYEKVEIEDDVFLGPSMVFTNVLNPRSEISRKNEYRKTLVKKGATIGANATIVCGHTIGSYAFVGAGAVVTKDVPDFALVYGSPARQQGWMCRCGERLPDGEGSKRSCSACNSHYEYSKSAKGMTISKTSSKERSPVG